MKFLLLALAIFGVAQAAVEIQPKSVQEALEVIKAAVPSDRIIEIVQACSEDPEVQLIQTYLRTEFPAVFEVIRNDAELLAFFADLNDAGVVFDWLNHLLELWGIDPIEFSSIKLGAKTCGGFRGVYEQIQEIFQFQDLIVVVSQVYGDFPEFAVVWDRISEAQGSIERILADPIVADVFVRLEGLDIDLQIIRDFINGLLGWSLE